MAASFSDRAVPCSCWVSGASAVLSCLAAGCIAGGGDALASSAARDARASLDTSEVGADGSGPIDGAAIDDVAVDDAAPDAASLPPMPSPSFLVGYNEAWFGGNFATGLTSKFDLAYVRKVFDGIAAGGGHVVRLWLFEAPQGFGLAASPPYTQDLSKAFVANFDEVLREARKRALWVYPTLLDANTIAKITGPTHTWGVALLNDTGGEQAAFNAKVVAPLVPILEAHKDNVFGIDVINEVQAAYKNGLFPDKTAGPRGFIGREVAFLKSKMPWVKVSASAGWPDDVFKNGAQYDIANGLYSGLGLDFYDLHVYSDDGAFPGATAMCSRAAADGVPVYLGEFGQKTHADDDTLQYDVTAKFLNNAKALCFKGALAWRFDPAESWWRYVRPDFSERPAVTVMKVFGGAP